MPARLRVRGQTRSKNELSSPVERLNIIVLLSHHVLPVPTSVIQIWKRYANETDKLPDSQASLANSQAGELPPCSIGVLCNAVS